MSDDPQPPRPASHARVFLDRPASDHVASNALAFAIRDGFPVSPGHTLVIPRRLVPTWFDATPEEQRALFELVDVVRQQLDAELRPDGYNIGINAGEAAGQTVMHLHVHVIPRFEGDVDDPRGGVRFVIPDAGNYKRPGHIPRRPGGGQRRPRLATGGREDPFRAHLGPYLPRATDIAILAAFVRASGVRELTRDLYDALERGARIRILTGDYLHLTQANALRHLLDLSKGASLAGAEEDRAPRPARASLEVRVVEGPQLARRGSTFHPKSWILSGEGTPPWGVAFVGSSNLSRAALTDGIEWNLRLDRADDPEGFAATLTAFGAWWERATPLSDAWLKGYAERAERATAPLPPGEVESDPDPGPPEPRDVQREALAALAETRAQRRDRALVVLATGLGKTLLAAFDVARCAEARGAPLKVLLLAHREELLRQAAATFRRVLPSASLAWFAGPLSELDGDLVLASVLKLGRPEHLARLPRDAFDYIIVDEAHHAHADSYRRILDHLDGGFRLGLTATPERTDGGDILSLFDDHVAYEAGIGEGVLRGHLVPFHYLGLRDVVDYAPIPWRSGRFSLTELSRAVETEARMARLFEAWQAHPGARTLVFTCSIGHADFVTGWLSARGVRAAAVHSGPESADRSEALSRLTDGSLEALVTVDLFNEGVDVPTVDRVVMLRPTESPVIFLQQLGRGLRVAPGKDRLTVIDFIGNHRVFLERARALVNLAAARDAHPISLAAWLDGQRDAALPPGCKVEVELEAKDLLRRLLPAVGGGATIATYRELSAARGTRPTAGELVRLGQDPRSLKAWETWFDFIDAEGHLSEAEALALAHARPFLAAVERHEKMTRSFKMVALQALLEEDALLSGLDIDRLSARSRQIMLRDPELEAELTSKALGDPRQTSPESWRRYWLKWPLPHWTTAADAPFRLTETHLLPTFALPAEAAAALTAMVRELVDYRLAQHRLARRRRATAPLEGVAFEATVRRDKAGLCLELPPGLAAPRGMTDVRAPDGRHWTFDFGGPDAGEGAKARRVRVASAVGTGANGLTDLLRGWFGLEAGQVQVPQRVRFAPSPDGWWVSPVEPGEGRVLPLQPRRGLPAFATLRAAAGWEVAAHDAGTIEAERVTLPGEHDPERCFAIRASGRSMDTAAIPWRRGIADGDWLVMRWARGASLGALLNRVVLIERAHADETRSYHIKRLSRLKDGSLSLESDNPEHPPMPARPGDEPLALLVDVISADSLAPPIGTEVPDAELAEVLGLSRPPEAPADRVDGHLFLLAEGPGALSAPDRLSHPTRGPARGPAPRPGETALVLLRPAGDAPWRVSGVARRPEPGGPWHLPEVDFQTWRALGAGRSASRRLPPEYLAQAEALIAELLARHPIGSWLGTAPRRCRLAGLSPRGAVRIDGGPDGFKERSVTQNDLAWVLAAQAEARRTGSHLDEALVNRLRYLDGTPKGSTRWIDTGWALVLRAARV